MASEPTRRVVRTPRTPAKAPAAPGKPLFYGVDQEEAEKAVSREKHVENDPTTPYCTCTNRRAEAWTFDSVIGIYVHADPQCWRPSQAYHQAALAAGIIQEKRKP